MNTVLSTTTRFGLIANVCAIGSLLMCFAQAGIAFVLGYFGAIADPHASALPHIQAVLMWGLGALVVVGLHRDRRAHGEMLPMTLGAIGLAVMLFTLYVHYHWMILTLAYLCLIAAVFSNQTMGVRTLYRQIKHQAEELEAWNRTLNERVAEALERNAGLERLQRFLSPQVASLVTAPGQEKALESHRRQIAVLFCDLRGFTEFSDSVEPEEAMELLQAYHAALGELVLAHNGTIDHRAGDGLMVIFNDPLPVEAPVRRAIELAIEMHAGVRSLLDGHHDARHRLGFSVGIAFGYATLGIVGHEGRFDYTANGNAVNLAARLCDEAKDREIVISARAYAEVEDCVHGEFIEGLELKGFRQKQDAFNVVELADGEAPE